VLGDAVFVVTQVGMLVFIVAGMAAVGLSLTLAQIGASLRDVRATVGLLVASFVVVPLIAIATARLLPMEPAAETAIVLMGCVAGAPFLPKLAQLAKGNVALAVGSMVLLMVVTVGYAPIVVPLAVEGATVDAFAIAQSLVVLMLIPLAVGLFVKSRYHALADEWAGTAGQASTYGLLIGIAGALLISWRDIVGSIGSWIFLGTAIVIVAGLLSGWIVGLGRSRSDRTVMALATAQRNVAAGLVVAASLGSDTVVYTLVAGLAIPVVLIVLAGEVGRRITPSLEAPASP
jgi:predicted Na+-dependent transporter